MYAIATQADLIAAATPYRAAFSIIAPQVIRMWSKYKGFNRGNRSIRLCMWRAEASCKAYISLLESKITCMLFTQSSSCSLADDLPLGLSNLIESNEIESN